MFPLKSGGGVWVIGITLTELTRTTVVKSVKQGMQGSRTILVRTPGPSKKDTSLTDEVAHCQMADKASWLSWHTDT